MERCLQLERVGMRTAVAEAQRARTLESSLPHPAGSEEGRVQINSGGEGVRVRSRRVVKGTLRVRGMNVQGQALFQTEFEKQEGRMRFNKLLDVLL